MERLTDLLENAGYNVQNAYYGGDALWAIEHGQYDLVLVDASLQDDQRGPMIQLMQDFAPLPWIAVVDDQPINIDRALRAGAFATIERNGAFAGLLDLVNAALRQEPQRAGNAPGSSAWDPNAHDDAARVALKRQIVEQQTLSALARSLSSVLDVDALLAQVVEAAVSLTNAEEGLLLLPDEEEQALFIRAHKGIDSETASSFRIKTENTLAGQVFRSGSPILVGDQGWQKIKTEYLVQSLLYVPLISKGTTIGVLGVNNIKSDRTFDDHDLNLLQDLAAHAAIAIENARLFEESAQRTTELQMLVQAGEAANSTLAIDRVLSAIAQQLLSALGVSQCYIAEQHPATGKCYMLSMSAQALWPSGKGPTRLDHREPGVTEAFRKQRMTAITPQQLVAEESVADWLPHRYAAQKIVYIPLFAHDQRIGLITLYHISNPFYADAYSNGVLTQVQQVALDAVLQLLAAQKTIPQRVLFQAGDRILNLVGANWCELSLWNETEKGFQLILSYGEGIWSEEPRPFIDAAQYPRLFDVMTHKAAFTAEDSRGLARLGAERYARSVLGVPLTIKERTAGFVLMVDTLHERSFSTREVRLAQALVLQAANALENARLFRELERSLDELHHTQSKLVQTARLSAMGELAAAVAHQISNPLTTILGDSELLLRTMPEDSPDAEAVEAIFRSGQRAHEVVRRLLTMARQQSSEEDYVTVDVNETVHNTLMLVKGHVQQGGVQLRLSLENNLPPVAAPSGQLEDVWLNLLLNARDAVTDYPSPEIGITSRRATSEDCIEVIVWDTGTGIPEDRLDEIFEPFYTNKPPGHGTGLGLHICRQVVNKCGGQISVDSVEREGTRFIVRLPFYHRQD
ncbi:MAG: GAF domain-containing protein [Chloroflexi bacterium]|nr:GAF domain-containing protein [Chloroflexota bacterium]